MGSNCCQGNNSEIPFSIWAQQQREMKSSLTNYNLPTKISTTKPERMEQKVSFFNVDVEPRKSTKVSKGHSR